MFTKHITTSITTLTWNHFIITMYTFLTIDKPSDWVVITTWNICLHCLYYYIIVILWFMTLIYNNSIYIDSAVIRSVILRFRDFSWYTIIRLSIGLSEYINIVWFYTYMVHNCGPWLNENSLSKSEGFPLEIGVNCANVTRED